MRITDHAALRYAERIMGIDKAEITRLCRKAGLDPHEIGNRMLALEVMGHDPKTELTAEVLASPNAMQAIRRNERRKVRVRKGLHVLFADRAAITVVTAMDGAGDNPHRSVVKEVVWCRKRRIVRHVNAKYVNDHYPEEASR